VVGWVIAGFSFLALAVGILVPVELMPRPSGEFQVGTMVFEVSDPDRLEPYGSAPEGLRRFRVQVWYPSEDTEGYQRADWLEDGRVVAPAVSRAMGFPPYLLSYGQLVTSNAYWNAPVISGEGLPFVIISHGWTGFKNLHADIAEDLASTGVVVMAIDHSFASAGTLFDDGQVALLIPEILPKRGEPGFLSDARGLILTFSADIQRLLDVVLNKTEQVRPSNGAARTGISGEVEFDTREPKLGITVLTGSDPSGASAAESLGKIDQQLGKVFQAVDSEFIGLVGHSTGAGAVVQTAIADPRIRGIVGMDPWVEPLPIELLEQGLPVPALLFRSEAWQNHPNDENLERLTMTARDSLGVFQIDGSTHNDFTMAYMFGPLGRFFGTLGSIGQQNMRNILTDSIRGFFTVLADPNPRAVDLFHAAAGHPQVGIAGF
jgi:dienelactone hydrolase